MHARAIEYFDKAYNIYHSLGDRNGSHITIVALKRIIETVKNEKYIKYLYKVEKHAKTIKDETMLADVYLMN